MYIKGSDIVSTDGGGARGRLGHPRVMYTCLLRTYFDATYQIWLAVGTLSVVLAASMTSLGVFEWINKLFLLRTFRSDSPVRQ